MQVEIDVFADPVCPWCFIGARNLAATLAAIKAAQPQIEPVICWMPFFLNPDTPPDGEPYRAFLEAKFGGRAEVDALQARVAEAGRAAGIEFAFERIETRPNSLDAQRLIYRAQHDGQAAATVAALVERIFAAHFLHGEDIGDVDTLARLAGEVGDDPAAALDFLQSGEAVEAVLELAAQVQHAGISGVPFFVINRKVALAGAQPPEALIEAIGRSFAA